MGVKSPIGRLHTIVLAFSFSGNIQYIGAVKVVSGSLRGFKRVVTASGEGRLDTVWVSYRLGTVGDSARSREIHGGLGLRWALVLG